MEEREKLSKMGICEKIGHLIYYDPAVFIFALIVIFDIYWAMKGLDHHDRERS